MDETMSLDSKGGERQSLYSRLSGEFDDSFVRDWARMAALRSRVFGSAADAWQKKLRQGVRAESALTRSFYLILGFVEYAFWLIPYAFAFFMGSTAGYDLPYDEDNNRQDDQRQ